MIVMYVVFTAFYLILVAFFAVSTVIFFRERFYAGALAGLIILIGAIFYVGPNVLEIWGLWRVG